MEQRTNSPYPRRDRPVLAVVGLLLVVSTVLFTRNDREHEWRYYQYAFKQAVADKFGPDKARTVPSGLEQIWVPALGHADRCVTCHQATAWKGFENADEPYRTHPVEPLRTHPPERFGCTSCHGGQGWAVDAEPAHGPVEHWEEPMLGKDLGEAYSLVDDKHALMQMNCNVCHRYDRETKGAEAINLAKRIVREKGCRACHAVNGRGGTIGPDLTFVGDKAPEQYRLRPAFGPEDRFRLARGPLEGPARAGRRHRHAEFQLHEQGGAVACNPGPLVAEGPRASRPRGRCSADRSADA